MHDTASQTQAVLQHLKAGRTLTAIEALEQYRILRLAARVNDLRGRGEKIDTQMVTDNGKRFARYSAGVA